MSKMITVFKAPVASVIPYKDVTVEDVYKVIKSDKYKYQTERIRQADDEEGNNLKKTVLDFVCFSCTCTRRNTKNIKSHSGYIAVDIDHLSEVLTERERILNDLPFNPALVFVSPKGKGLKIVFRIDTDNAKHEDYFLALESFFMQQFNIQIDKACKDIVRACFLCYDPDAIYNSEPTILDQAFIDTFKISTLEPTPIDDPSVIMQRCKAWLDKKESFVIGNRNGYVTHLAGAYNRYGIDGNTALNDLLSYEQSDFTAKEITATVESIYNNTTWHGTAKFDETNPTELVKHEKNESIPNFPIEGFPKEIRDYINACAEIFGTHPDYWAGALIAATALAIGDKLELKTKYLNIPVLWLCIVGDVSSGKTEPLKQMLQPFKEIDRKSFQIYNQQKNDYERYLKLSKSERLKEGLSEMHKPDFFQYLLNDFTPEAMADVHRINNRGIMIERDELKGWLDDFGRYSKSGEQSNMLSTYNRYGITYNRKGSGVISIPKPAILVAGGMQPDLLPSLASDSRADNGFLSRMCFIYPDGAEKPPYNEKILPAEYSQFWEDFITGLVNIPEPTVLKLDAPAHKKYQQWYDQNRDLINAESSGYLKGVYGKLDIIALRLAVVIKGMKLRFDQDYTQTINSEIMQSAIDITEYFRATALKTYHKIFTGNAQKVSPKDIAMFLFEKGNNKTEIGKIMKVHRQQIQRWTK